MADLTVPEIKERIENRIKFNQGLADNYEHMGDLKQANEYEACAAELELILAEIEQRNQRFLQRERG